MAYHSAPASRSIESVRGLELLGRRHRPGRQQGRGEIGDRTAHRLRELAPRNRVLLQLDRAHAEHQPRIAIGLVELQDALGEPGGFLDVAVGQHRHEGSVEQLAVARIVAQRRPVIVRRRRGVPFEASMAGGKIAAGGRSPRKIGGGGNLGLRGQRASRDGEDGRCGERRTPDAWRRGQGSSTPSGGRSPLARPAFTWAR